MVAEINQRSECSGSSGIGSRPLRDHLHFDGTLIVKYGGSAITVKGELETINQKALEAAAIQLWDVHQADVWRNLILVHGAGR